MRAEMQGSEAAAQYGECRRHPPAVVLGRLVFVDGQLTGQRPRQVGGCSSTKTIGAANSGRLTPVTSAVSKHDPVARSQDDRQGGRRLR